MLYLCFFNMANMSFNAIREKKFSQKFWNLQLNDVCCKFLGGALMVSILAIFSKCFHQSCNDKPVYWYIAIFV